MAHHTQRTEQHFIPETHPFYKWAMKECGKAVSLYNRTLYIYRSALDGHHENIPEYVDLIRDEKYLMGYDVITRMTKLNEESFRAMMKNHEAKQVVIAVDRAFRSWARAIASWKKDKSKFKGMPKPPSYKKKEVNGGTYPIEFTYMDAKLKKDGRIFIKRDFCLPIKTKAEKLQLVRIVPVVGGVNIEVVYNKEIPDSEANLERAIGIDLGLNNLAAITSNVNAPAVLVNGRPLKSIHQYCSKKTAKLQAELARQGMKSSKRLRRLQRKRNHKMKDYLHKVSRRIADFMKAHDIGTCIIGHNYWWKTEMELGKRNNQTFSGIAHTQLINLLRYKIEEFGGKLIEVHESHTSKCSFLDNEKICHHDSYVGNRKKRGMFITAKGIMLNADVNGSLNIIRRATGYTFEPDKSIFNPRFLDVECAKMKPLSHSQAVINGRSAGLALDSVSDAIGVESLSPVLDTVV